MIKHIVCFKLRDASEENCEKAKEVLLSMKENIDYIRQIEVGVDFLHSARSYDVYLSVVLDLLPFLCSQAGSLSTTCPKLPGQAGSDKEGGCVS